MAVCLVASHAEPSALLMLNSKAHGRCFPSPETRTSGGRARPGACSLCHQPWGCRGQRHARGLGALGSFTRGGVRKKDVSCLERICIVHGEGAVPERLHQDDTCRVFDRLWVAALNVRVTAGRGGVCRLLLLSGCLELGPEPPPAFTMSRLWLAGCTCNLGSLTPSLSGSGPPSFNLGQGRIFLLSPSTSGHVAGRLPGRAGGLETQKWPAHLCLEANLRPGPV